MILGGKSPNEFSLGIIDICSAHLKRPAGLLHRFVQHSGRLYVSTIVLAELYVWAFQRSNPTPVLQRIEHDLLPDINVLDFNSDCAKEFGRVRGQLLQQGISLSRMDLMIASVALVHNLIVVTHNTSDYKQIPNLRLDDWLTPEPRLPASKLNGGRQTTGLILTVNSVANWWRPSIASRERQHG